MYYFYEMSANARMVLQIFLLFGIAMEISLLFTHAFIRRDKQSVYYFFFEMGLLYHFIVLNLAMGLVQIAEPENLMPNLYVNLRKFSILTPILGLPLLIHQHRMLDLLAMSAVVFSLPFLEEILGPAYVLLIMILTVILLLRALVEIREAYSHIQENLSRFSMKQAFDTFPEGLAIGRQHGNIYIINSRMRSIMADRGLVPDRRSSGIMMAFRRMIKENALAKQEKLGQESSNLAQIFEETQHLQESQLAAASRWGVLDQLRQRRHKDRSGPETSKLPSKFRSFENQGKVYRYTEEAFQIGREAYWQILLSDITREADLIMQIKEKNSQLEKSNQQLEDLLQNLEEIELDKEKRRLRNRIHDVMGQRLSILHSSLQQMDRKEDVPLGDLVSLLEDMVEDLKEPESFDYGLRFQNIQNTAAIVGTQLFKQGEIPTNPEVASVFMQVLREAVTNAIRHGQADKVKASFYEDADHYYLDIANSGTVPLQQPREGEGISGMRHKLANLAGSLEIAARDEFTIKIQVPKLDQLELKED
ncbi:MAG: hypothetical protein Q4D97_02215 [Eubacteriales bacterium]|nr:hypothetical protein [Eubacteriales bacterium]